MVHIRVAATIFLRGNFIGMFAKQISLGGSNQFDENQLSRDCVWGNNSQFREGREHV